MRTALCGGAASLLRQRDDRDRPSGIDGEVVGGLALVRDDGVLAVRGDRDHVGLRTDGDRRRARRPSASVRPRVEEHEVTRVGLDGRLERDDARVPSERTATELATPSELIANSWAIAVGSE